MSEEVKEIIEEESKENQQPIVENQETTTEPSGEKSPNKKFVKIAIIAVVAIGVIIGGIFGIKAIVKASTIGSINGISDDFEDGKITYSEAIEKINSYNEETDSDILTAITNERTEVSTLKDSVEAYNSGLSSIEAGNYMTASTSFNKVIQKCKHYEDARKKIEENREKCKEETAAIVEENVAKENYTTAINAISTFLNVYTDEELTTQKADLQTKKDVKDAAEKEAKEEEEREAAKNKLRVTGCWVSSPDSVGGYELYFNYKNLSDKTMKYIDFGVTFINPVGDPIKTWRIDEVEYCQHIGPTAPGGGLSGTYWHWGKYYDSIIDYPLIKYIKVEYTDGTTWILNQNEIDAVQY